MRVKRSRRRAVVYIIRVSRTVGLQGNAHPLIGQGAVGTGIGILTGFFRPPLWGLGGNADPISLRAGNIRSWVRERP